MPEKSFKPKNPNHTTNNLQKEELSISSPAQSEPSGTAQPIAEAQIKPSGTGILTALIGIVINIALTLLLVNFLVF